jgi:hypothetical protein
MDLTQMESWGRDFRVEFGGQCEEVWLQTIGDRTEALERGHEAMQRTLLEFRAGSERAEAMKQALLLAPVEEVQELALAAERPNLEARLQRELPDPVRPRQDRSAGETAAAFAQRMAGHEETCAQLRTQRAERLMEKLEARRSELRELPREELAELALPRRIDVECWQVFTRTADDWVLLRAVRRREDHEQPYFADISQVKQLHPAVKEQLRRAYRELEPPEGDELPKS